ncbi:Uncharacterised protein [Serratia marcescens]|nr:Uncharacterised protein [Serratia marcescens]CUY54882.1 Uncharacterised protein [Serratia marcescens]CUY57999.1 Uncharacterised protein [Serratia marcescens]CUY76982.1 Uncharacterised protein [Serratia marcescens]CUZ53832.1 Uncharacterised protein [Serratia marcescens]
MPAIAAHCTAGIFQQTKNAQRHALLAVYRPAGIVQRLCVKLKRLATLHFPIAVIQRIAQRKALLFLAVEQPALRIVECAGGDSQPLAGQPLTASVIDAAGVFAVFGTRNSKLPLRRNLAVAIIDILLDAQRQVVCRLQYTFSVAQPVRRKLCSLQALHTAFRIVKTAADRLPAALTAHPATGVENVLRLQYLRRLTKNPPLAVIQLAGELHVQAAKCVDGALGIEQTGSAHLGAPIAGKRAALVVPAAGQVQGKRLPTEHHTGGAVGQLAPLKRQVAAALQGAAVIIEQAGCSAVNGKGLLRGQFAGTVEDIACGVKRQASAGLQPPAGIVERLRVGGDLPATLCGAALIVPIAISVDGECAAAFKPAGGVAQPLLRRQVRILPGDHLALSVIETLRR